MHEYKEIKHYFNHSKSLDRTYKILDQDVKYMIQEDDSAIAKLLKRGRKDFSNYFYKRKDDCKKIYNLFGKYSKLIQ